MSRFWHHLQDLPASPTLENEALENHWLQPPTQPLLIHLISIPIPASLSGRAATPGLNSTKGTKPKRAKGKQDEREGGGGGGGVLQNNKMMSLILTPYPFKTGISPWKSIQYVWQVKLMFALLVWGCWWVLIEFSSTMQRAGLKWDTQRGDHGGGRNSGTHHAMWRMTKNTAGTTKSSDPTLHLRLKTTIPGMLSGRAHDPEYSGKRGKRKIQGNMLYRVFSVPRLSPYWQHQPLQVCTHALSAPHPNTSEHCRAPCPNSHRPALWLVKYTSIQTTYTDIILKIKFVILFKCINSKSIDRMFRG